MPVRCPRGCYGTFTLQQDIDRPFSVRPGQRFARWRLDAGTVLGLRHDGRVTQPVTVYFRNRAGDYGRKRTFKLRLCRR